MSEERMTKAQRAKAVTTIERVLSGKTKAMALKLIDLGYEPQVIRYEPVEGREGTYESTLNFRNPHEIRLVKEHDCRDMGTADKDRWKLLHVVEITPRCDDWPRTGNNWRIETNKVQASNDEKMATAVPWSSSVSTAEYLAGDEKGQMRAVRISVRRGWITHHDYSMQQFRRSMDELLRRSGLDD